MKHDFALFLLYLGSTVFAAAVTFALFSLPGLFKSHPGRHTRKGCGYNVYGRVSDLPLSECGLPRRHRGAHSNTPDAIAFG